MDYIISNINADNFRIINRVNYHAGITSRYEIVCNRTFTKTEVDEYSQVIKDSDGKIKSSQILEVGHTITELSTDKFFKFAKIALEKCNEWFGTNYNTNFYIPIFPFMDSVYDTTKNPKNGKEMYADWQIKLCQTKYNDWDGWKRSEGVEMYSKILDNWLCDETNKWYSTWESRSVFSINTDMFKEICEVLNDYLTDRDDLHKVCGNTLDVDIPMMLTARNVCDMYQMFSLYQNYLGNDNMPKLNENKAAWFIQNVDTSNLMSCYELCLKVFNMLTQGKIGEVEEVTSNQCLWYSK